MRRTVEHRRIAGEFTKTVEGTAPAAWDNPAPPEGWVARDIVRHYGPRVDVPRDADVQTRLLAFIGRTP